MYCNAGVVRVLNAHRYIKCNKVVASFILIQVTDINLVLHTGTKRSTSLLIQYYENEVGGGDTSRKLGE